MVFDPTGWMDMLELVYFSFLFFMVANKHLKIVHLTKKCWSRVKTHSNFIHKNNRLKVTIESEIGLSIE